MKKLAAAFLALSLGLALTGCSTATKVLVWKKTCQDVGSQGDVAGVQPLGVNFMFGLFCLLSARIGRVPQQVGRAFMKTITENTLIPISLVIAFLGGVVWLTTLSNQTQANTAALKDIQSKQERYNESIVTIEKSLVRIEYQLTEKRR
jgi:hypothetical protein